MQQLIYTSVASEELGHDQIFEIVQSSARNNPAREVTGFLLFKDGKFLQLVEGPSEGLDDLLAILKQDKRHHSIEILARHSVTNRLFPRWRMNRLANEAQLNEVRKAIGDSPESAATLADMDRFLAA